MRIKYGQMSLTRRLLCRLLRVALRVFFRRVEVAGVERVPRDAPVIFVLNHPNGLIDPVFLLCLTPRRVSFLAKAPLFRMPVMGFLVRALDSLPVYRRQDEGEDTSRNRETFDLARALLARGGTIGICPEGVSHNEPKLRPLKTGAARIALSAASGKDPLKVQIVPAGLYYTAKTTFRSAALLYFGAPIDVPRTTPDESGEPPREAVRELSHHIEAALRQCILNAEHDEALATVARAERIFSAEAGGRGRSLAEELGLRRRFVEGYAFHRVRSPERLLALESRIKRFEEELKHADFDPDELSPPSSAGSALWRLFAGAILVLLFFPLAMGGTILHYPAYRLSGFFATRFSHQQDDVVSTIKIIAAMLFFPLTWMALALFCELRWGWPAAALALLMGPLSGYVAMRFFEELDRFAGGARAAVFFVTRRRFLLRLLAERRAIRNEILALGDEAVREPVAPATMAAEGD